MMKRHNFVAFFVFFLALGGVLSIATPSAVFAQSATSKVYETQTQTYAIKNMTCALCPITVRKAMEGVDGVANVKVNFDMKTATATFNPSVATVEAIAAASTNAGYPAKPKV